MEQINSRWPGKYAYVTDVGMQYLAGDPLRAGTAGGLLVTQVSRYSTNLIRAFTSGMARALCLWVIRSPPIELNRRSHA